MPTRRIANATLLAAILAVAASTSYAEPRLAGSGAAGAHAAAMASEMAPGSLPVTAHPGSGSGARGADALSEAYSRLATWHSQPEPRMPGVFKAPTGIDVGADGTIYVSDEGLGAVHVIEADGTPRALWYGSSGASLGAIRDIAASPSGVYVSDPEGERIHLLSSDGDYLGAWAFPGRPEGLAHAGDELYVVSSSRREITVLGPDGEQRRGWDVETAPLEVPWGIDVGPGQNVYVTDLGAKRVWIFERTGVLIGGLATTVDGVVVAPIDVAVDDDGDVFVVTEFGIHRLRHGGPAGQLIDSPGGRGVAVGPGSGLVSAVQDLRLGFTGVRHVLDRRAIRPALFDWGNPFSALGTLNAPRRLSCNSSDRAFILDRWPRIQAWSTTAEPISQFTAGGLHDIAAGLRGSVYGVDGHILRYWAEDGTELWQWQPPSTDPQMGAPYGWLMATDAHAGDLAVFDMGDQRLFITDFSANPLAEWPVAPADGFESISDVALAADRVYASNRSHKEIEVRSRETGLVLERWSVPGTPLRIDSEDGALYVLTREGWIWKYSTGGETIAAWDATESGSVADIAAGENGYVYVAYDEDNTVAVYAPDPSATPPEIPTFGDRCQLSHDKTADPQALNIGESTTIELSVTGECPLADARSDIMLLVDTSGSMSGGKMGAARSASLEFIGQLDYSLNQVGLVSFSTEVALVQQLTSNPRRLIRSVPELGDDAGTDMLAAFLLAEGEFSSSRARPDARQVIILLTDGRPNHGQAELQSMAAGYRSSGRDVYAIGLGLDVDRRFLGSLVTQSDYYFEAPSEHDLSQIYDTIARRVAASTLLSLTTVTDELPSNMLYVRGSAKPTALYSSQTRTLQWQLRSVPPAGLKLSYRVAPQETGVHPTNVKAEADYIDGVGHRDRLLFPVPRVKVGQAEGWTAYLPILMRRKCPEVLADIALVLDTSSSMRAEPEPGSPSKLEAAVRAARVFLGVIDLPRDRAAIVAFNSTATEVNELTGDHLALAQALDRLPIGDGTRLDRGLDKGRQVLGDPPPGRVQVVVLLTDGRQSGADSEAVLEAAAEARSAGVLVFTIGLGSDADLDLLGAVAGASRRAFYAPTEKQLVEIYKQIALEIPCQ